ncbi:MAG: stage V sporulation protein AD, partial [Ruminiclostridium sp.]|nr:stage V sporulation protein AD [Ruminiclostridium sp.]
MSSFLKNGTVVLDTAPSIVSYGTAVGRMEGEGPLGSCFDYVSE